MKVIQVQSLLQLWSGEMDCEKCNEPIKKTEPVVCVGCAGPRSIRSLKKEILGWAGKPASGYQSTINKTELTHIHNYVKELREKLGLSNDR